MMLLPRQVEIIARQMMHPKESTFNIGALIDIRGPFDMQRMRKADLALKCDPSLRVAIDQNGPEPALFLLEERSSIGFIDFSSHEEPLAKTYVWIEQSLGRSFLLDGKTPLLRHTVARVAKDHHFLVGNYHHVAYDGWATSLIYQRLLAFYNGTAVGEFGNTLPPLSFEEQLAEEKTYRSSQTFVADQNYWRSRLAGYDTVLFHGSSCWKLHAKRHSFILDADRYGKLRSFSEKSGWTIFHVMIALTAILLFRTFSIDDITLGLPVLNRRSARAKQTCGLFASVLPFRVRLRTDNTFSELLYIIGDQLKSDYRHQRFPVSEFFRGYLPYEVSLSYEKHDYSAIFEGTSTHLTVLGSSAQDYPLKVFVREYKHLQPVKIDLDYNIAAFSDLDTDEILGGFEHLIDDFFGSPDKRILCRRDRPATKLANTQHFCIMAGPNLCTQFESSVSRHGARPAVSYKGQILSYAELDETVNRLAWRLRELGVGADGQENLVGLSAERSPGLVVGMLGILKAGGTYVPLDPTYPADRLVYLVKDSGVQVVVGDTAGWAALGEAGAFRRVCLDEQTLELRSHAPPRRLHPQQAAYVIYTSGSTGQPKGCVVSHANVVRLFAATRDYGFSTKDVWTLFHSYAFDFSVWEVWGALLHGGRLVVVPYLVSRDPEQFAQLLEVERVSVLSQTPAAFRQLLGVSLDHAYTDLRLVVFGGEVLEPDSLKPWYARHGDRVRLVNMYGISETTVHVTEKTLAAADVEKATSMIGEPLKDLSLQVLDRYGEPVPTGVAGEIYVGGAGVTRCYLGRAALTAQRFVPDPYGPPGARLYRSGDVARRLPDGGLVYLGRADEQIKLRGFRIEPGEVEATLRAQEGVQDALVILDTPAQGKPRLVAYVTGVVEPLALRESLSRQLPRHMVPALIMPLERFSLTAHGKLDCKALPCPGVVATSGQVPRTNVEKMLARIWAEALHIPEPSIDDNFFSLGGDSMSALQVVAKARAAGIAINLEEFFSATGIRKIADNVKESAASSSAQMIPPFALLSESDRANLPTGLDDALPLSRLQGGMLFHSNLEDESSIFHDVFSFRLRIPWSEQEWRNAIERLPSYHAALRTSFHWTGYSEPLQLIHTFAEADYQIFDLRGLQADQRDQLIDDFLAKARRHPLDPSSGRMLRITLHRHADEELQLTLDFHHAIMDGWSVATLLTDLVRMATNVDWLPIPANASLTATFVSAEREAEADQALLNVWRERLANVAPTLLATHVSNERVGVRQIVRRAFRLPDSLAEGIEHRAKELGVSLKTVLLTAHLRALARTSGQAVVNTGYVTHGRPVEATAIAAVGLFLNTLPFSLALHPSSWTELVRAVGAEERAILAIRRLPALAIKALGGGVQFYDVGFNYIHFHVYAGLRRLKRFELLGLDIFEETDFPLLAQYAKDPLDGSLEMTLIRDSAIITEWQVEQFANLVLQALEALVSKPDASWHINAFPKRAAPAAGSCMESAGLTSDLCTHFESSVSRHGTRPAVSYESQILSYVELDEAANRLAWRLRELGVGADGQENLVGLSAERSPGLVVGMLGILKAGGTYVPLDPTYPADRLVYLVKDSGVQVVVGDTAGWAALGEAGAFRRVCLDEQTLELRSDAPPRRLHPQQAAYVIYTSGSTGQPKGCVVSHANVVRLFAATQDHGFSTKDVWTLFHSYAFDFSVWEVWGALLHGGRLVVVPYLVSRDPEQFAQLLEAERVSVLSQTPAAFRQLLGVSLDYAYTDLRLVVFGGEVLEPESLKPWYARHGDRVRLVNMYGITETTVHVTEKTLAAAGVEQATRVIGEPLKDLSLQVLDHYGEPVLTGVAGEIHVGGAGVTRGYLGRVAMTAQRFVPDPYGPPGARLYRSGDVARQLPDGGLVYLGRADQQIKLRGFRIEPGEVEVALRAQEGVQDAVVMLDTPAQGAPRLVAYVTGVVEPLVLRVGLSRLLPGHMVPALIMPLERFPLTAHGKLDRKALPRPGGQVLEASEAPRPGLEQEIAEILSKVLRLASVERNQNFLDIGGDSILATQAIFRLREYYGIELPLRYLLEAGTVAGLAIEVADKLSASYERQVTEPVLLKLQRSQRRTRKQASVKNSRSQF